MRVGLLLLHLLLFVAPFFPFLTTTDSRIVVVVTQKGGGGGGEVGVGDGALFISFFLYLQTFDCCCPVFSPPIA